MGNAQRSRNTNTAMAPSRAVYTTARAALRCSLPSSSPCLHHRRLISAYGYEQAKVLALSSLGEPKDVLHLHSHSIAPPHSDLLTLRFLASPINPADINQIQGVYPTRLAFGTSLGTTEPIAVGGNEGVAEVIAKGGGVQGLEKGDWVIMKNQGFGTWRTHAQTKAEEVVVVGTVSVNPMTAWRMLRDFVSLKEGEWFVQNAANSGVGRAAIQLGKLLGYKSLNIVRKRDGGMEELKADLTSLGADAVVTDEEFEAKDFRDRVKELTDGGREPIRLGLNCVGGPLVGSMAKHLAAGAHMVTYGAMSKKPVKLPTGLLIFKDIHFDGFWVSKWSEANPREKETCIKEVLKLTREGKFKDVPMSPVTWNHDTKQDELVSAVQGTLEGFRSGKGIFVFGNT
ncbi:mitochondrial 2-enoyl thioester reductase [Friedmanniomyces endolithicus]|nr:mitochondrial 2-enoyl thioester reductase [Friedmanniomyces endolithicus]